MTDAAPVQATVIEIAAIFRAMAGGDSMAADGSRPARPGATSAQPFVRVAGEADGCHRIITSHAPEDGCTDCAPAIVDG